MSPSRRRWTALGAIAFGVVAVTGGVAMLAAPDRTRTLRCDRAEARCVVGGDGDARTIELAAIEKAYVAHSRAGGHSLQVVTSSATEVLGKQTTNAASRREYEAAAEAIDAIVGARTDSVDVTFTHRVGLMPWVVIVPLGLGFVVFGVHTLRRARHDSRAAPSHRE